MRAVVNTVTEEPYKVNGHVMDFTTETQARMFRDKLTNTTGDAHMVVEDYDAEES